MAYGALDKQLVELAAGGGLAEGIDPRMVPQGSMLVMSNASYNLAGAITKRNGYGAHPAGVLGGGSLPAIAALLTPADRLAVVTDAQPAATPPQPPSMYTYAPAQTAWMKTDSAYRVTVACEPAVRQPSTASNGFVAEYAGNLRWFVWFTPTQNSSGSITSGVYARAVDATTGQLVFSPFLVNASVLNATTERVCYCVVGQEIAIVTQGTGGAGLSIVYVNMLTGAVRSTASISGTTSTWVPTSCMADLSGANPAVVVVGYDTSAHPDRFLIVVLASTNAILAGGVTTGSQPVRDVSVYVAGGIAYQVFVGGIAADHVYAQQVSFHTGGAYTISSIVTSTSLGTTAPVGNVVKTQVALRSTGDIGAVWTNATAGVGFAAVTAGSMAITANISLGQSTIGSRPFLQDGLLYMVGYVYADLPVYTGAPTKPGGTSSIATAVLYCLDGNLTTTAQIEPAAILLRQRASLGATGDWPTTAYAIDTKHVRLALPVITSGAYNSGANSAIDSVLLDFSLVTNAANVNAQACGATHLAGGYLGHFDGDSYVENGFIQQASVIGGSVSTPGGGNVDAGLHGYATCYVWYDRKGNIHRSAPSFCVVDNTTASRLVTLSIRPIGNTKRGLGGSTANDQVFIEVYRTIANSAGPYYRMTPPTSFANVAIVAIGSPTFVDNTSDVTLQSLAYGTLYTDGGELETISPPATNIVYQHKNRIWLVNAEDPYELWYSKPLTVGKPPEFNDAFTIRLDGSSSPITALAGLDDKLLVFTAKRAFYISGDGPNETGQGGQFSQLTPVQIDSAVTDQRGIATIDAGAFYQSDNGITVMGRNLSAQFIGLPVDVDAGTYSVMLGARVDSARQKIYWLTTKPQGVSPAGFLVLVYDYLHGVWTTWTLGGMGTAPVHHAMYKGKHLVATAAGLFYEAYGTTPGWDPSLTWVTLAVQFPWIALAGINGYQRCYSVTFTGRKLGDHQLVCQIWTDYQDAPGQTTTTSVDAYTSDGGFPLGPPAPPLTALQGLPVERFRFGLAKQKCSAVRVGFYDTAEQFATFNQTPNGFDLIAATLEIGVKPGRVRLPVTNTG